MFDKSFALLIILIGLPVFIAISLLIIFYDGFPVLFSHNRIGKNGKIIKVYKFRSMIKNAEEVLNNDKELYNEYIANGYKIDAKKDPRILPFGIFLRKSSLDEIPQFLNVLKGNMAIVGPRPVVEDELNTLYGEHKNIYKTVKPGITGLWQISGRSNLKGSDRVDLDLEGIKRKSFFFDLYVIFKTVIEVFKRRGAY
jgi:exopolysaccharide production protein ExoY